jgi:hypothetical protein
LCFNCYKCIGLLEFFRISKHVKLRLLICGLRFRFLYVHMLCGMFTAMAVFGVCFRPLPHMLMAMAMGVYGVMLEYILSR